MIYRYKRLILYENTTNFNATLPKIYVEDKFHRKSNFRRNSEVQDNPAFTCTICPAACFHQNNIYLGYTIGLHFPIIMRIV